jgi:hypothetical protein
VCAKVCVCACVCVCRCVTQHHAFLLPTELARCLRGPCCVCVAAACAARGSSRYTVNQNDPPIASLRHLGPTCVQYSVQCVCAGSGARVRQWQIVRGDDALLRNEVTEWNPRALFQRGSFVQPMSNQLTVRGDPPRQSSSVWLRSGARHARQGTAGAIGYAVWL